MGNFTFCNQLRKIKYKEYPKKMSKTLLATIEPLFVRRPLSWPFKEACNGLSTHGPFETVYHSQGIWITIWWWERNVGWLKVWHSEKAEGIRFTATCIRLKRLISQSWNRYSPTTRVLQVKWWIRGILSMGPWTYWTTLVHVCCTRFEPVTMYCSLNHLGSPWKWWFQLQPNHY